MNAKKSFCYRLFLPIAIFGMVLIPADLTHGQAPPTEPAAWVDDWTHHHLVYSNPGTEADAVKNRRYEQWYNITHDPRYQMQKLKRSHAQPTADPMTAAAPREFTSRLAVAMAAKPTPIPKPKGSPVKKDWSVDLNGASVVGTVSTNNATGSPLSSVTIDSVALNASPPTTASASATFSANPTNGQTMTITNGSNSEILTATGAAFASITGTISSEPATNSTLTIKGNGDTLIIEGGSSTSSSCTFTSGSSTVTFTRNSSASTDASRVAALISISGCGSVVGVGATNPTGAEVTITATTVGTAGNSITVQTSSSPNFEIAAWTTATNLAGGASLQTGTGYFAFTNSSGTADTTTVTAGNLAAAITNATVGVTGSSSGAQVTVTATTAGSSGNLITVAEGLSNITFPSALSGGGDGTNNGTTWAYWSGAAYVSQAQVAANIASTINSNGTLGPLMIAVANGNAVTVTALTEGSGGDYLVSKANFAGFAWSGSDLSGGTTATVQPNTYPAKYGVSLTGASCSDFVIYPTGMTGSATAANIVAYNNLYVGGCATGAVPSEYWAFNTSGAVTTSPILSYDGTQVAYIQSNGTTASLVLLQWAGNSGTLTAPVTPTVQSSSTYNTCTTPCSLTLPFANSANDTFSAPFYDYVRDALYVGDDSGNLHQFTGVFNGNPAESGSPWPVHLGGNKLSSPVYDSEGGFQGGYVFVGDMGGVFYSVGTGYAGTTNGQIHGNTGSLGDAIADAPLVDSSEGTEYVFVTTNGSYSYTGDNGVWEFVSSFTALGTPGVVPVGTGGTGYYLYAGDYDNVYYDSGNPAYGHLYVVGNTGTAGGGTLYQVEIAYSSLTGTVNAVATGLNSTEHPFPSPLTEFCNNGASACAITSQRSVTGKVSTTSPKITILTVGNFHQRRRGGRSFRERTYPLAIPSPAY